MKYIKPAILCALAIILMVVIFIFSAQPAEASSAMSSPLAQMLVKLLYPSYDSMSAEEQTALLDTCSFIVRKGAHFAEYTLLGSLITLALGSVWSTRLGSSMRSAICRGKLPLIAICAGAFYAATDELHQRFVPGRSGQLSDWLLDSVGVATGVLIILLIAQIKSARHKNGRRR